jgi:hypothetical protein
MYWVLIKEVVEKSYNNFMKFFFFFLKKKENYDYFF